VNQDFPWRKLYEAAMLELDRSKLQARIDDAYAALRKRAEELMAACDDDNRVLEERQAIADALHGLRTLEKVELQRSSEVALPRENYSVGEAS
jgi:hypothetical protein